MNSNQLAAQLSQRRVAVFDLLNAEHFAGWYSFCVRLCLEDNALGQALFEKAFQVALKDTTRSRDSVDFWFYQAVHKVWMRFTRFKPQLKGQDRRRSFDWQRPLGDQHLDALVLLTPAQREIFLYRIVNKFTLTVIRKITGHDQAEIVRLFEEGLKKVSLA